jgi:hypothetical protein
LKTGLITLRIDVDYPFPSRFRSFFYVALGIRVSTEYLKNSKIIAMMINESPKEIQAHWFFTPKTIPDLQMLTLTNNSRHALELHVVNDPVKELANLEKKTGRKASYYTIHGTARLLARIMWRRWKASTPTIPENFRLKSFHDVPTFGLDKISYTHNIDQTVKTANDYLAKGQVLYFHPIWLFQKGTINQRSAYYQSLRTIFEVDNDLETLVTNKKAFFRIAYDAREYETDIVPTREFLEKIRERGVDIFTFIERKWCNNLPNAPKSWVKTNDNVALLKISSYDDWLKNVGKKTRNMIRKASKSGVETESVIPDEKLANGMWRIYNETPIRQERAFPVYGISLKTVEEYIVSRKDCTYIGAYLQNELIGFIRLLHGENVTILSQILAMQKHLDLALNNALIAKAVEACASKREQWLMYARMGNHPTLDRFKENNGFTKYPLTRYYIPLTEKGDWAIKLRLQRKPQDVLPDSIKYRLIPFYNWISRTRMKIKLRLSQNR